MFRKSLILFIIVVFFEGCAGAPIRTHSQFDNYFQNGEKLITVVPITIKFYKLTAGGVPEEMDEWDMQSDSLFKIEFMEQLDPSPKIKIRILEENNISSDLKEFLNEQSGLYRAISESIIIHTYMEGNIFPLKLKDFDYTLGPQLSRINDFIPSDALLFISGTRSYWTGGRVFLGMCGALLGAATGIVVLPGCAPDWISAALVDSKTGNIIWFRYMGAPNSTVGDLRDEETVSQAVGYLFKDFIK